MRQFGIDVLQMERTTTTVTSKFTGYHTPVVQVFAIRAVARSSTLSIKYAKTRGAFTVPRPDLRRRAGAISTSRRVIR